MFASNCFSINLLMDLGASGSCQALLNHLQKTRKLDAAQTQNSKREGGWRCREASSIEI